MNKLEVEKLLGEAIKLWLDFKLNDKVIQKRRKPEKLLEDIVKPLNKDPMSIWEVMDVFKNSVLPYCTNFSATKFMWFPDAGNSISGLVWAILSDFLQQNLINQNFCAPSATFVEVATIQWLRTIVGYSNNTQQQMKDIEDVGGIITGWGTTSNAIAMLLARERYFNSVMSEWLYEKDRCYIVIPKWIWHYSIRCSQMWLWLWLNILEVDTDNFCYDLDDLTKTVVKYKGKILALIAYAWDSRTMAVDHFLEIYSIIKTIDPNIWLHADACHGFVLGCSSTLKHKIQWIELFDSITTDPHKVFNLPYVISALLLKDPTNINLVTAPSDLITKENFSFGKGTPFIGSKPWLSLKLRFFMQSLWVKWLEKLVDHRYEMANLLAEKIREDDDFILLNEVGINSVMFMFQWSVSKTLSPKERGRVLNEINMKIYQHMLEEGIFYLHSFPIPDAGYVEKGITLQVLRFMSWNPNLTVEDLSEMLNYIKKIGYLYL